MQMAIVSDQLQQHIQDDLPAITPSDFWAMKGKEEASKNEGMDLAYYATQKMIAKKIRTVDGKQTDDAGPKKLCVCAPTNHAGSFKCRLHRICATHDQKSSSSVQVQVVQTRLSRLGRATTTASIEYEHSTPNLNYQDTEKTT